MGLQFADINGDGSLDILTATFDGTPHISYGSPVGFTKPVRMKDAYGERIIISSIWDYKKKSHINLGRALPDQKAVDDRCISALAFDWDADGDHDLLLGSYEMGRLFVQMNEGSDASPKFTGKVIPVMAGDKPFQVKGKMTAPKLIDWDRDGDMDIVTGSFGDSYGGAQRGGVFLSLNTGTVGRPAFSALQPLIPADSMKGNTAATRPDAGLYPEVADWDGDGDLDLIVGGYSMWTPPSRDLSAQEVKDLAQLERQRSTQQKSINEIRTKRSRAFNKAVQGVDPAVDRDKFTKIRLEIWAKFDDEYKSAYAPLRSIQKKIEELKPAMQRKTFVWFYERIEATSSPEVGRR